MKTRRWCVIATKFPKRHPKSGNVVCTTATIYEHRTGEAARATKFRKPPKFGHSHHRRFDSEGAPETTKATRSSRRTGTVVVTSAHRGRRTELQWDGRICTARWAPWDTRCEEQSGGREREAATAESDQTQREAKAESAGADRGLADNTGEGTNNARGVVQRERGQETRHVNQSEKGHATRGLGKPHRPRRCHMPPVQPGVNGGVKPRINGEQRVAEATTCRVERQRIASRQAALRLLRCAPAPRVTRRNPLTQVALMAGSRLPAVNDPLCENTAIQKVNPHILCSPLFGAFGSPSTPGDRDDRDDRSEQNNPVGRTSHVQEEEIHPGGGTFGNRNRRRRAMPVSATPAQTTEDRKLRP